MIMNTYVSGFVLPNERWKEMKAIWDDCAAARINAPPEVYEFFEGEPPTVAGQKVDIDDASSLYVTEVGEGLSIDLSKVPKEVTHIKFIAAYQ